jgi:hypothetical protein
VGPQREFSELSVKGEFRRFPSLSISGVCILVLGRWLKTAVIKDEEWLPGITVIDPKVVLSELEEDRHGADLFTFGQKLPGTEPRFPYHIEWTNVAAIPIKTYEDWWTNGATQVTRKNIRRAARKGITVKNVEFNDDLIGNIVKLNNSALYRQQHRFGHYGKSFEAVKKDYSDFIDRSEYLGAYYQSELVGLLRIIHMGEIASIMQLLCMPQHYDKRPANALISGAVERCAEKEIRYLTYGRFIYGVNTKAPLKEFKRRNGFQMISLPSYYIPLTFKGRMAVKLNLHMGIKNFVPKPFMKVALDVRRKYLEWRRLNSSDDQAE